MEACGLGLKPKPSYEAPTEASVEIQPEEASVSPNQHVFSRPENGRIRSVPLPETPPLSTAFPSLFPPQSLFPSAPYSSPLPRIPVDPPSLF